MNIILFGCGQGGKAVKTWLPADVRLLAWTDNKKELWGTSLDGIPVIPPKEIPSHHPDLVYVTVLNREAAASIAEQLRSLGYAGQISTLCPLRKTMDLRLSFLRLYASELLSRNVPGAVAELGVYQGDFAAEINRLFPERRLYLFDTFEGFASEDLAQEKKHFPDISASFRNFEDTSVSLVRSRLPYPNQAVFCPGYFPRSLPDNLPCFAFVSLDPDLYEPVWQGLCAFWPLLSPGGAILIHDYNSTQFPGAGAAARRFCREHALMPVPLPDLHGSAVLLKPFLSAN